MEAFHGVFFVGGGCGVWHLNPRTPLTDNEVRRRCIESDELLGLRIKIWEKGDKGKLKAAPKR